MLETQALEEQILAGAEFSSNPVDEHTQGKAQVHALKANRFLTTLSVLDDLVKEPSSIPLTVLTLTT